MTPLHLAAERARLKAIEYLVGKEADIINRQDRHGVNNIMCDCSNDEVILLFALKQQFPGT